MKKSDEDLFDALISIVESYEAGGSEEEMAELEARALELEERIRSLNKEGD